MEMHFLNKLFNPFSIAVIGASARSNSVGMRVFNNILKEGYTGHIFPINPNYKTLQNLPVFPTVNDVAHPIDLAVIVTPAKTVPGIIVDCGKKGIKAAIVISAGFSETGSDGALLEQEVLKLATQHHIHILGPNCLGIMRPHIKLNATFDNSIAIPGHIALVSQSGAIIAAILDWASNKRIGFSNIISLGNAQDVGFGETLDFLALDSKTKSILLYIEGIHHARRFMSGLRIAARMKPVIVIKGGRHPQGTRAALSHTGALVGDDDAFDTALRRAGAVRVMTIAQLFSAAEILSRDYRTNGNRLAIITNGGGAGVMAADRASELNIVLPQLSNRTLDQLNTCLPTAWSHQNPIDILGDATPERYQLTVSICSEDENIDGILTILIPVAMSDPFKVATQIILEEKQNKSCLLACWMGGTQVKSSKVLFNKHKIPYFDTPEAAVEAFSYLAEYQRNQQLLLQVPEPFSYTFKPNIKKARLIVESALSEQRHLLTTIEAQAVLNAFNIPTSQTIAACSIEDAIIAAKSIQFPVAMKINSPDITHKLDVNGVVLNIENVCAIPNVFNQIIDDAKRLRPDATILGVTVEKMYVHKNNRELLIGVIQDKAFGPVITFGAGGSFVEIINDRAIALPPLNRLIIEQLISRTHVSKALTQFRNMKPINLEALISILLCVSEMVCELPHIQEMDINPLVVNDEDAIVVDVRIKVSSVANTSKSYPHMAICPYPSYLISTLQLSDGTIIVIRPIRPEDAKIEQDFVRNLSPQSKYYRFMEQLQELTPLMLVRFTQIDYDREMALIATYEQNGYEIQIGVARYIINPVQETCEFALVIADEWQHKGIGRHLMQALLNVAKSHGVSTIKGDILYSNLRMLQLVKQLGFSITSSDDPTVKTAQKDLI